jgi:bifunctional NMN adenylyltransferase/nudix hydrolase
MLMLKQEYPDISILPLYDMPNDNDWSKQLDKKIDEGTYGAEGVALYGSRDSFIPFYSGKHKVVELEDSLGLSGTKIRASLSDEIRSNEDFRRGVLYAAFHRHKCAYTTVDMVLIDDRQQRVLLGRKASDPKGQYRFPGGFLDPEKDKSILDAAKRELYEETGLTGGDPVFVGSLIIDDWRYRKETDKIMTCVYRFAYLHGGPVAGDDLDEVSWFSFEQAGHVLLPQHQPIWALAHLLT